MSLDTFIHTFIPATLGGADKKPLLLLPRTGADELDLVPIGKALSPGAALLAVRGNVLENGKPRFFRRLGHAQFDVEDSRDRTAQLGCFIREAQRVFGIESPVAVGHSNGANIAWSLMFADPSALSGAILFRPLMPIDPGRGDGLWNFPVLVLSGSDDKVAPPDEAVALPKRLFEARADVTHKFIQAGHDTVQLDFDLARDWLNRKPSMPRLPLAAGPIDVGFGG